MDCMESFELLEVSSSQAEKSEAAAALMELNKNATKNFGNQECKISSFMPLSSLNHGDVHTENSCSSSESTSPLLMNNYFGLCFDIGQQPFNQNASFSVSNQSSHSQVEESGAINPTKKRTAFRTERDAQAHRNNEKKRRQRINLSLHELFQLIPDSRKPTRSRVDKAEIIQTAISYIKYLHIMMEPLLAKHPLNKSDKLFGHCKSQSNEMALICLNDRLQYYLLGYQECFKQVTRFLKDCQQNYLERQLANHLQMHQDNFNIGTISKYMKKYDELSLELINEAPDASSFIQQNISNDQEISVIFI